MGLLAAFVLAIAVQAVIISATPFSWKNCATSDESIAVTKLEVEPSPLRLPGPLTITVDGATTKQLSHTSLSLAFTRKTFLGLEIPIPCIAGVGSCTYKDMCYLISNMTTNNWGGISAKLGTQIDSLLKSTNIDLSHCPQQATALHLDHKTIQLPAIPSLLTLFAKGDYHIHATATDTATNQEIICLDLYATIDPGCSGLGCIIG